eukprot:GHVU01192631.1.p1 GENE.GHVU01192631.1~~GHVU01192631.1.p1  ORF type:complete len:246 (+),score=39.76 GHVU01192631.1:177-914(+)
MGFTIWSCFATVVIPAGIFFSVLVLLGIPVLRRIGIRFLTFFTVQVGRVKLQAPLIIASLSLFFCASEFARLQGRFGHQHQPFEAARASMWRHQRNWWISLLSTVLWASLWRLAAITEGSAQKLDALKTKLREAKAEKEAAERRRQRQTQAAGEAQTTTTTTTPSRGSSSVSFVSPRRREAASPTDFGRGVFTASAAATDAAAAVGAAEDDVGFHTPPSGRRRQHGAAEEDDDFTTPLFGGLPAR